MMIIDDDVMQIQLFKMFNNFTISAKRKKLKQTLTEHSGQRGIADLRICGQIHVQQ